MDVEWRASEPGDGSSAEPVTVPGRPAAFAGADAVRYVADLDDDPRSGEDDVAVLHLDGCFARAEVELAGDVLGRTGDGPVTHDAYFAPLSIPFRPADGERIAVTCRAPDDRFGGLFDTDRVPEVVCVPGIWWDAGLETTPLPAIADVTVRPELTADGARLHVRTTVLTDEAIDDRITYSLRPAGELQTRGTMNRGAVETAGPGVTTVEHTVEIRDPALWWPRGHGDQHRYALRAKLGDSERTVTTGIREVDWADDELRVNGEPVAVRGVNLVTADTADVDRAVECNANLVRAHAHVLPPEVYAACDEAGLLVWQDLPLTGPGEFDVDRGRALAETLVARRASYPSLAAVGVHDEPTAAFADGLGSGLLDGLRLRWRAWRTGHEADAAERVAEAIPDDLPAFPVVGDPGTDPAAIRLFAGWDYGDAADAGDLLARYPADVVAEFGAGARTAPADGDAGELATVADFDVAKHAARVGGDVDASQAYQAAVLAEVTETFRRRGVDAITYALRDPDAGAGMGIYAVDGTPKTAADALATAFEPVQAFLASPDASESAVVVRNDGPTALSGEVRWVAGDAEGSLDVTVDAGGRWRGGPIALPSDADAVTLTVRAGGATVDNEYDRA